MTNLSHLDVAIKYDMTFVVDYLHGGACLSHFLASAPIRTFAIASLFNLEDDVQPTAQHSPDANIPDGQTCDDLRYLPAYAQHQLLEMHWKHATAAEPLLKTPNEIKCLRCDGHHSNSFALLWW